MSVFEDKIKNNQNYFDNKEPDFDHMSRFTSRLDKAKFDKRRTFHPEIIRKVAAGITIIIAVGFLFVYLLNDRNESNKALVTSIEYSQELNDVFAYYDAVSNEKINEIDQFVNDSEKAAELKQVAIHRLEDIDGSLASIEKELSKNPENENIKATLINIKRKKVEVMDDILTQLDFANTSLF